MKGICNSLKKGGWCLYDADHVEPNPEWQTDYRHVGVAISSLTVEAIGGTAKDKGKNVFVLGLLAKMFDLNVSRLELLIRERFGGKSESGRQQRPERVPRRLFLFDWQPDGDLRVCRQPETDAASRWS
jgi:Pyruvate/2-oxoacid:ferredoxin oxidoreductase gamma subunit